MNAQNLKNSILQLAIQGKLVEQREEEGTAKELLERIAAEKKQLLIEGKLRKQKPLPTVNANEIPYGIPKSWEWIRLGDLINISSGKGLTSKQMEEGDIPVFGGNGITGYHNIGNVEKETVVIGRVGYYCGSVHITPTKAWVTDNAFITKYPENHIDKSYLVYILRHLNLGRDNNATAQPVVSGKKIYPILFPLPPLEEQKRIVEKIEELMPFVEKYDKAYSKVEKLNKKFPEDIQKSILQYAIQGKLVEQREFEGTAEELYQQIKEEKEKLFKEGKIKKPKKLPEITEDEIPFDIPESWRWVRLSDVLTKITDGTHHSPANFDSGEYMYVTAKNIKEYGVDLSNITYVSAEIHQKIFERCNPEHGDILLIKDGATTGIVAVNNLREQFSLLSSVALLKVPTLIFAYYIVYALRSDLFYRNIRKQMKGTGITRITLKQIEPLLIPLPPLEEQKRIVEKIEQLLPYTKQLIK